MTELVRTYKLTDSGAWGWVTEEAEGGGGGSLPAWWTVDSTPGSESVDFAGGVTITPGNPASQPFMIVLPDGFSSGAYTAFRILHPGQDPGDPSQDLATIEMDGLYLRAGAGEGANKPVISLLGAADSPGLTLISNGKLRGVGEVLSWSTSGPTTALGFFGGAAAVRQELDPATCTTEDIANALIASTLMAAA